MSEIAAAKEQAEKERAVVRGFYSIFFFKK